MKGWEGRKSEYHIHQKIISVVRTFVPGQLAGNAVPCSWRYQGVVEMTAGACDMAVADALRTQPVAVRTGPPFLW
jgi:hypothetical protein